jgi:hypothetical protein
MRVTAGISHPAGQTPSWLKLTMEQVKGGDDGLRSQTPT